ncbi:MAG: ThuA domain-containing protein [Verrucomicrobia bacterium]|nr:ThuA domain-containing protein [Verrucomicrobiota bacterium]
MPSRPNIVGIMSGISRVYGMVQARGRALFRLIIPAVVIFCLSPILITSNIAADNSLYIHMITGAREYRSSESLSAWAEQLERRFDIHCTLSLGNDGATELDNLDQLEEADLLVVFCRRLELNEASWSPIAAYLESKRPIIGLRTASHAFDRNYTEFDDEVLGADYNGHYGGEDAIEVSIAEGAMGHPVLNGIKPWTRSGKLYKNSDFSATTQILLIGEGKDGVEPVAWINVSDQRRVFYTPMGVPSDFEDKPFLRLLHNAIEWTTGKSIGQRSSGTATSERD